MQTVALLMYGSATQQTEKHAIGCMGFHEECIIIFNLICSINNNIILCCILLSATDILYFVRNSFHLNIIYFNYHSTLIHNSFG